MLNPFLYVRKKKGLDMKHKININAALPVTACVLLMLSAGCSSKDVHTSDTITTKPKVDIAVREGQQYMADNVAATVNNSEITQGMVQQRAYELAVRQGVPPQMLQQFMAERGDQVNQAALEQLVHQAVLSSEAKKQEIEVSKEEVDKVFSQVTSRLPEGMTLEQALEAQGVTEEELRDDIRDGERIRKLYEANTQTPEPVDDKQVQEFYDDNKTQFISEESVEASHILVSCAEEASEDERAKAEEEIEDVLKQLKGGGDFEKLAEEHSDCPSKSRGGDLGSFTRGKMVPAFEQAAFKCEVGELSPIVKTRFGYHVIKVTDKQEAGTIPLKEVSENIREYLKRQQQDQAFEKYIEKLRSEADIRYN